MALEGLPFCHVKTKKMKKTFSLLLCASVVTFGIVDTFVNGSLTGLFPLILGTVAFLLVANNVGKVQPSNI